MAPATGPPSSVSPLALPYTCRAARTAGGWLMNWGFGWGTRGNKKRTSSSGTGCSLLQPPITALPSLLQVLDTCGRQQKAGGRIKLRPLPQASCSPNQNVGAAQCRVPGAHTQHFPSPGLLLFLTSSLPTPSSHRAPCPTPHLPY